ncbi:alpha/beta fold hydrolase [Roseovarius salinarum]|uniref:alpha/beta fold hydrolase n=1 Tax=Roseovarius salinarum TaxID=1981892 RepID=UPI000C33662A|nr:alpha/beta hydrolase [Roseovarius salinarum]
MTLAAKLLALALALLAGAWGWVQHRARAHEARAEAAFPPEGQLIEVDGHHVHAVVDGQGPDLVLIHGSSGNTRDMTHSLAGRLADEFRVIVLDRPGLGYTDRIDAGGATIGQQARLLSQAARKLGADRPVVLGHSYGGAVALAWAVHRPQSLSALVAVAAPSNPWPGGLPTFYRVTAHPVLGPLAIPMLTAFVQDARVERAIAEVFAPQAPPDGYIDHFGAGLTLRRASLRANALQRAGLKAEIREMHTEYGSVQVPTEILHGTADTTVGLSIHSEPLARQIPGAMLTRLDGVGHMPHHVAQDAVVAGIRRAAERAGLRPGD